MTIKKITKLSLAILALTARASFVIYLRIVNELYGSGTAHANRKNKG